VPPPPLTIAPLVGEAEAGSKGAKHAQKGEGKSKGGKVGGGIDGGVCVCVCVW
jgi:hypothetical protein